MNNHHPLLSIVPILLTSPAWAGLCADQDSFVGQTSSSSIGSAFVLGSPDETAGDADSCPVDACIGGCQATCPQAPLCQNQIISVAYAQMLTQLCYPMGPVHTGCGVVPMACPMNFCAGWIQCP